MLKKSITFEDLEGNEVTEDFYFMMTKTDLVRLEIQSGGFEESLRAIIASNNGAEILSRFEKIILDSYGEKSADGKRFLKSKELSEAFAQTPAYDALIFELATETGKAAEFVNGIVPKGLANDAANVENGLKSVELPAVLEEHDTRPAYIRENRTPTTDEFRKMSDAEKMEAFKFKVQN